jgi:excisionase family DNA binding protein
MKTTVEPEYFNYDQAATYLGLRSKRVLKDLVRKKLLRVVKFSHRTRCIARDELDRLAKSMESAAVC